MKKFTSSYTVVNSKFVSMCMAVNLNLHKILCMEQIISSAQV